MVKETGKYHSRRVKCCNCKRRDVPATKDDPWPVCYSCLARDEIGPPLHMTCKDADDFSRVWTGDIREDGKVWDPYHGWTNADTT